jgi:hypothetical protein
MVLRMAACVTVVSVARTMVRATFVNFVSAAGGGLCGLVGYAGFAMTEGPLSHVISRRAS